MLNKLLRCMFGAVPYRLEVCGVSVWKLGTERVRLVLQGPLQDFEDLTRIKGRESFYPLSELIQLEDEDIVRHAMEAALSEGNNIGSSDLLDNHMSSDSTALDSSCNFFEWLRQDKQLCQVLS